MSIEPSAAEQVGPALLGYLRDRIPASDLGFAEPLEQVTRGWETYIYTFSLTGSDLDPAWERPLILRIYPGDDPAERALREAAVQRFAKEHGYPAPYPLALETEQSALGRPFMVMERAPGLTMLERIMGDPRLAFKLAPLMADLQVALHRLPVDGCPLPSDKPLVSRRLKEMQDARIQFELQLPPEAERALAWLADHRDMVVPEEVSLCHQDFHPLNIIVGDDGQATVIDWTGAALGDRHSDIANTLVLLETAPANPPKLQDRLLARFGRGILVWLYLRHYRRRLPIDRERLRFWQAMRAAEWWGYTLALDVADSEALGLKPNVGSKVPPGHAERMEHYFWQKAQPRARPTSTSRAWVLFTLLGALGLLLVRATRRQGQTSETG